MSGWKGKLTKLQAIQIVDSITDQDDPYWEYKVEDFYDEDTDTISTS